ncbi:hypothetical protein GGF37_007074, partial [Kickxella alabastrina]
PLLRFCLAHGDLASALRITQRILALGGALTDAQWARLLRLCVAESRYEAIGCLYDQMREHPDGNIPKVFFKYPGVAEDVMWALRLCGGREREVREIARTLGLGSGSGSGLAGVGVAFLWLT